MGLFSKSPRAPETTPGSNQNPGYVGDGSASHAELSPGITRGGGGDVTPGKPGRGRKEAPKNPHLERGRAEMYGFYYDQAKARRNWQLFAFGLLGLVAVLTFAVIGLATSVRYVPYMVETGELGEARYLGPVERLEGVEDRAKPHVLGNWVRDVRSIYGDPSARQDMLYDSYAHTANDALDKLQAYYADPETDPGRLSREGTTRSIEIESVVLVPNPAGVSSRGETYKVSWRERTKGTGFGGPETQRYEGYFNVIVIPPANDKVAMQNPLGIYVSDFNWGTVSGRE